METGDDDALLHHAAMFAPSYHEEKYPAEHIVSMQWIEESALYLVRILSLQKTLFETNGPNTAVLSSTEIVQLLLPWCILHLQSPKTTALSHHHFLWKAIVACISVPELDENVKSKLLSQSLLFKLVPKVARWAVFEESDTIPAAVMDATTEPSMIAAAEEASPILAAYQALLHLFHPTMDVACKTVLIPLLPKEEGTDTDRIYHRNNAIRLLRITLLWMRHIHGSRKRNPKTTFQLLSEPEVLKAFAQSYAIFSALEKASEEDAAHKNKVEGHDVVRDLLWDGLFHPQHHMEGWMALCNKELSHISLAATTASNDSVAQPGATADTMEMVASGSPLSQTRTMTLSGIKTYQGDLLDTIAKLYDVTAISSVTESLFVILPVLFQGFVQQSNLWNQFEKEKQGSARRKDTLSTVQFHVFVCWTRPLLQSVAISSSLPTLRQMLQIVHDFGIYAPTPEDAQYMFLEYCVSQILLARSVVDGVECPMIVESIECLHLLVQLNHMLLHDDYMIESINLCLTVRDEKLLVISCQFVATIIDTYRKLRQQRHIFRFILEVVSTGIKNWKYSEGSIGRFTSLLQHQQVVSAISDAMVVCPIVEVKNILEIFNEWLMKSSNFLSYNLGTYDGLSLIVHLLSNLTFSIRVDSGTAPEIAPLCHTFISSSIPTLANLRSDTFLTTAMSLTGVVLGLHTRCVFWLRRNELLCIPETIALRLSKIRKKNSHYPAGDKDELDSAIFLSCHQLQQLHSLIHDQNHWFAIETTIPGNTLDNVILEATEIATFISNQGEKPEQFENNVGLIAVAQNLSTWVGYVSEKRQLYQFLCWVVAASTQSIRLSLGQPFIDRVCTVEDVNVASSLLADATFFQHKEVDSLICIVGISLAAEYISKALSGSCEYLHRIPFSMNDYNVDDNRTIVKRMASCREPRPPLDSLSDDLLHMAHCTILLINSLQKMSCDKEYFIKVLDRVVDLDQTCRSLCSKSNFSSLAPTVSALRVLMARLLGGASTPVVQSFLSDDSSPSEFLCSAMSSVIDAMDHAESIDSKEVRQLVESTGKLVHAVLGIIQLNSSSGSKFAKAFSRLCSVSKSTMSLHALVSFSREILVGLKISDIMSGDADNESVVNIFTELLKDIKDLATEATKHWSFREDSSFPTLPTEELTFTDGLLLLGDLLCIDDAIVGANIPAINDMRLSCIDCLQKAKEQRLDASCWNVVCYLTGKVAQKIPCTELVLSILDALFCDLPLKYETFILEAAVCNIVPKLPGDSVSTILEKIVHDSLSPLSAAIRLRLTKLMLRHLTSDAQKILFATFGRKIFTLALSPLRFDRSEPCWSGNIVAACAFLRDLLERRDVLSLKGRDVALLLSYLVRALGPVDSTLTSGDISLDEEESAVYASIAAVFGTVLHCYTKQVSNCAPSVISVMLALLRHAMYCPSSLDENQTILIRVQHFTRLCEVIVGQRDVFKKYAIGLVLEFMSGVEHSRISLVRKEALIPAVYFLLDTMTSFEMNQLNAHMNTTTRILFRSVHQKYLKLHSYRGQ
jgi:Urb2/Npa2 family